jgi:hypothetical protein
MANLVKTLHSTRLSRRAFLKLTAFGFGSLSTRPSQLRSVLPDFPSSGKLGRIVCASGTGCSIEVKSRPDMDSPTVKMLVEDTVLPWLKEVIGARPAIPVFNNQRWVETPEGFIYGPYLQPVENRQNAPVMELPKTSLCSGMWAEVTVPYVDVRMEKEPTDNSWVKARMEAGLPVRLYFSQVFWVDQVMTQEDGQVMYRVNPNYYGGLDMLWVAAEALRPLNDEDLAPIHPEVEDKRIEINVTYQTLSCFEGNQEVYFCRVATGAKFNMFGDVVDAWATPVGEHRVARKFISLQMAGGTTGAGYDLPGIGWVSIFATGGVAIHSTFWHNNYGDPMSHGCVNANPQDAHWIFRWTQPQVSSDPGMVDVTVTGQNSTKILVQE